jgi:hypothetical protein
MNYVMRIIVVLCEFSVRSVPAMVIVSSAIGYNYNQRLTTFSTTENHKAHKGRTERLPKNRKTIVT